jgi:hypothetical protein
MKKWSEITMKALHEWLAPRTWDTAHDCDMGRFHVFVASVWNDIHAVWDEDDAREFMKKAAESQHHDCKELISEVVEKRKSEGTTILNFLSSVRREGRLGLITTN